MAARLLSQAPRQTKEERMSRFAVIDTETTWGDDVMSIGIVIADSENFDLINKRYYILTPFKNHGGMYTYALYSDNTKPDLECSREKALDDLKQFLAGYDVVAMFAYNASFDYRHLPELAYLDWYDIMKLAAYRQYNTKIPPGSDCYGTGRLKSGYGVESIYRMLSEDRRYSETHNALIDAIDELKIMKLLNHELGKYSKL
jgi:DNA polymerase III epsilon subunit-like protein